MIINNNIPALNTYRQMGTNNAAGAKAMEKLSSGLRINRAGDDAAGLAISEKMRAQVRGLDQASRNSQDGISMIQTAEGALQESHNILQRMRELATQASNDTNVEVDRNEIQKEVNQLTSELNRIGNTTEFNTQKILKGDGKSSLASTGATPSGATLAGATAKSTTEARITSVMDVTSITEASLTGQTFALSLEGESLNVTFEANDSARSDWSVYDSNANSARINIGSTVAPDSDAVNQQNMADSLQKSLQSMIDQNDTLKGNYKVSVSGNSIVIEATKDGAFAGAASSLVAGSATVGAGISSSATGTGAVAGATTAATAATGTFTFATSATAGADLQGKGFSVNGKTIEFYDATKGAYAGTADIAVHVNPTDDQDAVAAAVVAQAKVDGVQFSAAGAVLTITATKTGLDGNDIKIADGAINEKFNATFQIGANQGQAMTIEIGDMRAQALGVSGKAGSEGFTVSNTATDGTSNTSREASLDVSTHESASKAITTINNAIEKVSAQRSNLGAFQNRLEHTISNLNNSSENLQAAESRIRDVDMAKEVMEMTRANILGQASQAMLAQANQKPQSVMQLLG